MFFKAASLLAGKIKNSLNNEGVRIILSGVIRLNTLKLYVIIII